MNNSSSSKNRKPTKLDKAVASAVKQTNAELEGTGLMVAEGVCPKCSSPDVDLKFSPKKGLKCWDCGEIYEPFPGFKDFKWM